MSLRIAEDPDLNINSEGPYGALIIDQSAFTAKANMCTMNNHLKVYYEAWDWKYTIPLNSKSKTIPEKFYAVPSLKRLRTLKSQSRTPSHT